ncbi:MAG: hypothetical protein AAF050_22955 [Cyanobacteria bacterium J06649_5]
MLPAIIAQLEQLIAQVEAAGPVAEAGARLDISTHSQSGHEYARLRHGSTLKSCGRVGSEKHLEVLATLQRRDQIAQLSQAIESLNLAQAIPVTVPPPSKERAISKEGSANTPVTVKSKPKAVSRQKKATGRKQLYTHVKTRQGSVTHAVLGKDKAGEWRTAALCGATPPKRDRHGWDFPTHGDGVTCPKCYRKLPANGKRHFPDLG